MGSLSIWHWIIVGLVVLVLFGRGRISEMMGDFGKGIKAFRKGLADDEGGAQANARAGAERPVAELTAQPAPREGQAADPGRQV